MNWYIEVLTKYAVFAGRARRREYWYFFLFSCIISIILSAVDVATGNLYWVDEGIGLFSGIYGLAVFIPSTAVTVRRLHDTNRSGWWLFIVLVPLILLILVSLIGGVITDEQPPQPPITGVIVLLMLALPMLLTGAIVSAIVLLIFTLQGGTQGLNRYGGDPKQAMFNFKSIK